MLMTDPRTLAAYTYAQAGRLLDTPASTIRSWKKGQKGFLPPIPTDRKQGLSYNDLVEIYVLRSLRTREGYQLNYVRGALGVAQEEYGISNLFLHESFRHDGYEFFLDQYGQLASLSESRQMVIRGVLKQYLKRIDYGTDGLAKALYLITKRTGVEGPKLISCNPDIAFGRPIISRRGIRTAAIISRVYAGESRKHIIADFRLTSAEFDEAYYLEAA